MQLESPRHRAMHMRPFLQSESSMQLFVGSLQEVAKQSLLTKFGLNSPATQEISMDFEENTDRSSLPFAKLRNSSSAIAKFGEQVERSTNTPDANENPLSKNILGHPLAKLK